MILALRYSGVERQQLADYSSLEQLSCNLTDLTACLRDSELSSFSNIDLESNLELAIIAEIEGGYSTDDRTHVQD